MDRPEPFESHEVILSELVELLKEIKVTYFRFESPPKFPWDSKYDYCSIDATSKGKDHIENFSYWKDFVNTGGILSMVVPKSTPEKLKEREKFSSFLATNSYRYRVYNQFYIFEF